MLVLEVLFFTILNHREHGYVHFHSKRPKTSQSSWFCGFNHVNNTHYLLGCTLETGQERSLHSEHSPYMHFIFSVWHEIFFTRSSEVVQLLDKKTQILMHLQRLG